ncbi:carboxylesterase family protein [Aquimarina penaris]|uniref:carboxylesterase family protein n=1 Tax=Aquimarina penaris TaxID=3231044 RepID=UPI003463244D
MKIKHVTLVFFLMFALITQGQGLKNALQRNYKSIPFIITTPDGYSKEKTYPTIIFLHGGDRSNTKHHPTKYASKAGLEFPFIVIAPSCTSGCSWSSVDLKGILNQVKDEVSIDQNRIYLVGYSMGGAGTWANLKKMNTLLAAATPLAPAGGSTSGLCDVKDLSIRVYHGTADYGYDNSKRMIKTLKECGANTAELISLEGKGHGIWPGILSDASFYEWLLKQSRN